MKITIMGFVEKEVIDSQVDLDVEYSIKHSGRFTIISFDGPDSEIFKNYLISNFSRGYFLKELELGIYKGRLVDVGKYGFGIFCDINTEKEVLIDLNTLRSIFGGNLSTRQYIYQKGLIDGLCVDIELIRIELGTERVWGKLSSDWIDMYLKDNNITVSNVELSELKESINNSPFRDSFEIIQLCKSSFILKFGKGIDPPGVVSYLGKRLKTAKFGIVGDI